MSSIRITIQLGDFPDGKDLDMVFPLDECIVRDLARRIDIPSPNAGIAEVFCTSRTEIKKVKLDRDKFAKFVSEEITEHLVKALEDNDTIMGYKK